MELFIIGGVIFGFFWLRRHKGSTPLNQPVVKATTSAVQQAFSQGVHDVRETVSASLVEQRRVNFLAALGLGPDATPAEIQAASLAFVAGQTVENPEFTAPDGQPANVHPSAS